jgi:lysophospholipase L1-like esterase
MEIKEQWKKILQELKALPGNAEKYDVSNLKRKDSPLKGKKILFLGSSVTYGACSLAQSFVEDLEAIAGIEAYKEAVSGTTLANRTNDGSSYYERLLKVSGDFIPDAFVCQLSTNDATKGAAIGTLSETKDPASFDISTTIGAMETIIVYVQKKWKCPVIFYTGTKFENETYQKMVDLLYKLRKKWGIHIIDLWNDAQMNAVSKEEYALYMHDPIHPTKAGYILWWTPVFERRLEEILIEGKE